MSDCEKNKLYKESQCSLTNLIQNNQYIDKKLVINLLVLIKGDLTSKTTPATKNAALEMLEFLCRQKSQVILEEVFELLANSQPEGVLYKFVFEFLKKKFKANLDEDANLVDILKPWMRLQNKLPDVLNQLFRTIPRDDSKIVLVNKVIPILMSLNVEPEIRNILIDVAFKLSPIITVYSLEPDELELFLKNIFTEYIPTISSLRQADYPNWDKMWIFLVRFCDKHIHNSMDLTNKLLRVVEFAFRSTSYVQRLKGYDCWKELIANASLDMNYMSGPKHIKLLVTPLKAKFSKQEVVICKRFEVFCYLLEKLGSQAVLCLPEFLDFCFGAIRDSKNALKCGQGKSVPQLWPKSARVLIEIIGHSHKSYKGCVSGKDCLRLEKPIITEENFHSYQKIIINSVGECCALLKDAELGTELEMMVSCMWARLFHLAYQHRDGILVTCCHSMMEVLDHYSTESKENRYFQELVAIILNVLLSIDKTNALSAFRHLYKPFNRVLIGADGISVDVVNSLKPIYSQLFNKTVPLDEKIEVLKDSLSHMVRAKGSNKNGLMLLLLINECVNDAVIKDVVKLEDFDEFLMWPVRNLHLIDENLRKDILINWMRLYSKLIAMSEERKIFVLKDLERIFKNNPLLAPSVLLILNLISQCETKFSHDFVVNIINVISLILELPNLKFESQQKLSGIMLQYCDGSLSCFKSSESDVIVKNICTCLERILSIHGYFKILETFSLFILDCAPSLRAQFAKYLSKPLEVIYQNQSNINSPLAKSIHRVLQLVNPGDQIQEEKKIFVPPSGRAARIANLAKNSPQSPPAKFKMTTQPKLVRLFGKDLELMSSLKVKGSQLNNTTPKRAKKLSTLAQPKPSTPSINDESSSQFVAIDTEINFQPEKLNEHQKEVMKKRREDIPALYQDLSQSQSQDMFSSKSNSRDNKENLNEQNVDVTNKLDVQQEIIESTEDQSEGKLVECGNEETFKDVLNAVDNSEKFTEGEASGVQIVTNESASGDIFPQSHDVKSGDLFSEVVVAKDCELEAGTDQNPIESIEAKGETERQVADEASSEVNDGDTGNVVPVDTAMDVVAENEKDDEPLPKKVKKRGRKRNSDRELARIRMDIVGADDFLTTPSRRSTRKDQPKQEQRTRLRKSSGLDKNDAKTNTSTRKTTDVVNEVKATKDIDTPNTSKRDKSNEISPSTHVGRKKPSPNSPNRKQPKESKTDVSPIRPVGKDAPGSTNGLKPQDVTTATETTTKSSKKPPTTLTDGTNSETPKLSRRKTFKMQLKESIKSDRASQSEITDWIVPKSAKRKGNTEEETEDVIESSQESPGNITSLLNASKKRRKMSDALEVSEDSTLVQQKTVTLSDFDGSKEHEGNEVTQISPKSEDVKIDIIDQTPAILEKVAPEEIAAEDVPREADVTQDSTITQDSTQTHVDTSQESVQGEEVVDTCKVYSSTQDTLTQPQETQETQTQSEFSISSEDRPTVLYFDLPKKPTLTESEQMMCRMDTMSICTDGKQGEGHQSADEIEIRARTPPADEKLTMDDILATPSTNSIPSSPITVDTPNRTTDLLNDTIDISPITSKSDFSDRDSTDSKEIPVAMNIEYQLLEEFGAMDNVEVEKQDDEDDDEDRYENVPPPEDIPDAYVDEDIGNLEDVPETVDDAIVELDHGPAVVVNVADEIVVVPVEDGKIVEEVPVEIDVLPAEVDVASEDVMVISESDNHFEPSQGTKAFTTIQERSAKLLNIVNFASPASKRSLNKRRGAISSIMSPSTGRIKRLMSSYNQKPVSDSTEDVNTEDILTFTREVPSPLAVPRTSILKRKLSDSPDVDGVSPCAKRKRVNFSDPCLTSKKIFIKDDYEPSLEAKRLFDPSLDVRSKEENLREIFELVDEPILSAKHTETETPETEPPMEMINPMILRKDRPVYVKLVDCEVDVMVVLKRVTSPMFVTTLMNKLKQKNIKTIGDLAKLSESEVNRFPFKVPVVANVFKALDNYYKRNVAKDEVETGQQAVKVNGFHEEEVVKKAVKVAKVDAKAELKQIINRIRIEDIPLQDLKDLLTPLRKDNVIKLLSDHFQVTEKDFLDGRDLQPTLLYVLGTLGVTKTIGMLFDIHNGSDEYSSFIAAILEGMGTVPLSEILRRRSIDEIHNGLSDVMKSNVFGKQDIVDKCLLPLIQNPSDIGGYLSKLSVVELSDVVLERLQGEKFDDFLTRIAELRPNAALERLCPPDNIVTCFKRCIDAQPRGRQVDIMVEMYKFISGKLDAATLVQLHVDFLSKVPDMLRNK